MYSTDHLPAEEIIKRTDFQEFFKAAKHFCYIIESYQSDNEREFILLIQNDLLTLYSLGRSIPVVDLKINAETEITIPDTDVHDLLQFTGKRVPFSYYWATLNPLELENKPETGCGDLIDDLGDTYKDLKEGILLFEKDDAGAKENALFKFRFGYRHHWGEHCIDALQVIHQYLQHGM